MRVGWMTPGGEEASYRAGLDALEHVAGSERSGGWAEPGELLEEEVIYEANDVWAVLPAQVGRLRSTLRRIGDRRSGMAAMACGGMLLAAQRRFRC